MKLGVLQFFSWPDRRIPLEQVYQRAFQRIEITDRGGYDAVWLAEHHFSSFSICPSIHLMGTHVAARTSNLRIGTGVSRVRGFGTQRSTVALGWATLALRLGVFAPPARAVGSIDLQLLLDLPALSVDSKPLGFSGRRHLLPGAHAVRVTNPRHAQRAGLSLVALLRSCVKGDGPKNSFSPGISYFPVRRSLNGGRGGGWRTGVPGELECQRRRSGLCPGIEEASPANAVNDFRSAALGPGCWRRLPRLNAYARAFVGGKGFVRR